MDNPARLNPESPGVCARHFGSRRAGHVRFRTKTFLRSVQRLPSVEQSALSSPSTLWRPSDLHGEGCCRTGSWKGTCLQQLPAATRASALARCWEQETLRFVVLQIHARDQRRSGNCRGPPEHASVSRTLFHNVFGLRCFTGLSRSLVRV